MSSNKSFVSLVWEQGYQAGFKDCPSKYPNPTNAYEKEYEKGYKIGTGRRLGQIH